MRGCGPSTARPLVMSSPSTLQRADVPDSRITGHAQVENARIFVATLVTKSHALERKQRPVVTNPRALYFWDDFSTLATSPPVAACRHQPFVIRNSEDC
jgi:hypothetical protein